MTTPNNPHQIGRYSSIDAFDFGVGNGNPTKLRPTAAELAYGWAPGDPRGVQYANWLEHELRDVLRLQRDQLFATTEEIFPANSASPWASTLITACDHPLLGSLVFLIDGTISWGTPWGTMTGTITNWDYKTAMTSTTLARAAVCRAGSQPTAVFVDTGVTPYKLYVGKLALGASLFNATANADLGGNYNYEFQIQHGRWIEAAGDWEIYGIANIPAQAGTAQRLFKWTPGANPGAAGSWEIHNSVPAQGATTYNRARIAVNSANGTVLVVRMSAGTTLVAIRSDGDYHSWHTASEIVIDSSGYLNLAGVEYIEETGEFYVSDTRGNVWRSADDGVTWSQSHVTGIPAASAGAGGSVLLQHDGSLLFSTQITIPPADTFGESAGFSIGGNNPVVLRADVDSARHWRNVQFPHNFLWHGGERLYLKLAGPASTCKLRRTRPERRFPARAISGVRAYGCAPLP